MNDTIGKSVINQALARAREHAPFLRLQLERFPAIASALSDGALEMALELARHAGADAPGLAARLRRERSATALALAIGDLAGLIPLEGLVTALSDLADRALEQAIAAAIAERTPDAPVRGFAIIALG